MREDRAAILANQIFYELDLGKNYLNGAPHLKHLELRSLYVSLAAKAYERILQHVPVPKILDLGAGEGTSTLVFLNLGAYVTAVDVSESQLWLLQQKSSQFSDRLTVLCDDVHNFLSSTSEKFDIVIYSSFLHHIPDYLLLIEQSIRCLSPGGLLFSFQDPLRYDSLGFFTRLFSKGAYFAWRVFQGDIIGGMKRYIRRSQGIYLPGDPYDDAEYHVTRKGVDHDAILSFLIEKGFECEIATYFSTQSALLQPIGRLLGVKNTFAIIAERKS